MENQKTDATNAPQELAQLIHKTIQNMPAGQREAAHKRVIELLLLAPYQDRTTDIMACLEPGFQNMQGRA